MESSTVIEPGPGTAFDLRDLWASRELLGFLIWRDLTVRYKHTVIGVAWAILQPLMAMAILTVFFGRPAQLPSDGIPYPLFAYAGLLAWTFFANALFSSSNSLVGSGPLITKVYFPRLLIPVASVGARLVDFAIAFVLLLGLMAYYHVAFTWRLAFLPPLVLMTILLALGGGMFLSALNVKYRDVNVALPHAIQGLMFATPVFYSTAMLPRDLRSLEGLNPLAVLIEGYRAALFGRAFGWPALVLCAVLTLLFLVGAVVFFQRMEEQFADLA